MSLFFRAVCAATLTTAFVSEAAWPQAAPSKSTSPQTAATALPTITIRSSRKTTRKRQARSPVAPAVAAPRAPATANTPGRASLTVPTSAQATTELQRTPGGVEVVPDGQFKTGPAQTVKDIVDWTPGVWAQPKWGDDTRLSIRGSGLSRNFHLRSTQCSWTAFL